MVEWTVGSQLQAKAGANRSLGSGLDLGLGESIDSRFSLPVLVYRGHDLVCAHSSFTVASLIRARHLICVLIPRHRIPDNHGVTLARNDTPPVRAKRHAGERGSWLSPESEQILATANIPDFDRAVVTGRDQPPAVGTPGDRAYNIGMPA